MKTFVLIDLYNLYFRAVYSSNPNDDMDLQKGLMLHTMFFMIKKVCDMFNPTHLVVCSDGNGTWRKRVYPAYKMNRVERLQDRKPSEVIRDEEMKNVFENDFIPFLKEKTCVSFLEAKQAEADDLIARFIAKHPTDNCIIVSTDNDYIQLLNDNVIIYNTMEDRLITNKGMFNAETKQPIKFSVKNGKVNVSRTDCMFAKGETNILPMEDWIDYALFNKCIRGDVSDNIISAYPRVREQSTKQNVGVMDAFLDRKSKGFNWQSFMNSTWENPLGEKKLVKECYEFNKRIIDLQEIPEEYKEEFDKAIDEELLKDKAVASIGFNLGKYLSKWKLEKLLSMVDSFSCYFSRPYPKD